MLIVVCRDIRIAYLPTIVAMLSSLWKSMKERRREEVSLRFRSSRLLSQQSSKFVGITSSASIVQLPATNGGRKDILAFALSSDLEERRFYCSGRLTWLCPSTGDSISDGGSRTDTGTVVTPMPECVNGPVRGSAIKAGWIT